MSRTNKMIEFTPASYGKPVKARVLWVHPRGRYIVTGYVVQTPFGPSPEIRECLQIVQGKICV